MKIQILGTGCPKCHRLAEAAQAAATDLGCDFTLEKITDIGEIMEFGVMMTPGLAVDGEVKCVGRVPTVDEVKQLLA